MSPSKSEEPPDRRLTRVESEWPFFAAVLVVFALVVARNLLAAAF